MTTKKRLGELLLESGVIDEAMLQSALGHQRRWGGRLGQALLDLKLVGEGVIVEALARKSGIEVARLAELEPYALEQAMKLVPREFAQRNNIFPMSADTSTVTVAMSDPTNLALTDELRFRTGRRVKVCIAGDREIAEAIRFHFPQEYQAPASIALDIENTGGDGVPLADPFEGGSTEDMRAMLEPTRHASATSAPLPARPLAPQVASAAPVLARPAVQPPAPSVASVAPVVQPQRPAAPAGSPPVLGRPGAPGSSPARTVPPVAARPGAAAAPARPISTPAPVVDRAPAVTRPIPTGVPAPAPAQGAPPPAAAPVAPRALAADATQAARDALLGAIPRGGFAPEEPYEELTPAPADDAEPISADLLVPEEEMVEGRVPIRELSPRDVAILDALDQLARGVEDPASPLKATRVAATLLRLLLKKKLVGEAELLDELSRR
jgi:type IV pilus assembly protein PilB